MHQFLASQARRLLSSRVGSEKFASIQGQLIQTQELLRRANIECDEAKEALLQWTNRGQPGFDADGLVVWDKNVSFLSEPRFVESYNAGIESGHRFTTGQDGKLHVEWRVAIACWAAKHALHLKGDFVECGTNTGILSLAICRYVDFNKTNKSFFLFDTFNGIPSEQATQNDRAWQSDNKFYFDCWDVVNQNFKQYPNVHLIRGKVPDTLGSTDIEAVSYLSIDMNIAYPERAAMEYFWEKLVPGAITILDDYGFAGYEEQKVTLDEFAAQRNVEIFTLPTGQGLLIKP